MMPSKLSAGCGSDARTEERVWTWDMANTAKPVRRVESVKEEKNEGDEEKEQERIPITPYGGMVSTTKESAFQGTNCMVHCNWRLCEFCAKPNERYVRFT